MVITKFYKAVTIVTNSSNHIFMYCIPDSEYSKLSKIKNNMVIFIVQCDTHCNSESKDKRKREKKM